MQYIPANEAAQSFNTILDQASKEPIVIQRQNKDVAVLVSPQDYQDLHKLRIKEFQEFRHNVGMEAQRRGLTENKLQEILAETE